MSTAAQASSTLGSVPDSERLVTISVAADFLSVSQVTIRRYLTHKKLRRFKVGGPYGRTLVKMGDVLGLVREADAVSNTTKKRVKEKVR